MHVREYHVRLFACLKTIYDALLTVCIEKEPKQRAVVVLR